jgi:hypothetical protein
MQVNFNGHIFYDVDIVKNDGQCIGVKLVSNA